MVKCSSLVTQVNIPCTSHDDGILWCLIGHILFGVLYIPPPPLRSVNHDDEIFPKSFESVQFNESTNYEW